MRLVPLAVIAASFILAAQPTWAQDQSVPGSSTSNIGAVNAVAFDKVPADAAIEVDPLDDSNESLALKKEFEQLLRKKGYTIADKAKLVLSFDTQELKGAWIGGGDNRWLELYNQQNHTGTEAPSVQLNLYKSDRGGLLNRLDNQRPSGTRQVASSKLRLDVTLDDSTNGKRLWQGWSVIDMGASDDFNRHKSMVPPLVNAFGKTVRQKTFPIP